jgi:hypothetical protein
VLSLGRLLLGRSFDRGVGHALDLSRELVEACGRLVLGAGQLHLLGWIVVVVRGDPRYSRPRAADLQVLSRGSVFAGASSLRAPLARGFGHPLHPCVRLDGESSPRTTAQ